MQRTPKESMIFYKDQMKLAPSWYAWHLARSAYKFRKWICTRDLNKVLNDDDEE